MSTTLAIGIGAFLILVFAYFTYVISGEEGKKEHIFLRLLLIFFFLNMLILLSKSGVDNCEIKLNHTDKVYVYGSNFTGYHWDYDYDLNPAQSPSYELFHIKEYNHYAEICLSNEKSTSTIFHKNMTRLVTLFWIYVIIYFTYVVLKWKGIINIKQRKIN